MFIFLHMQSTKELILFKQANCVTVIDSNWRRLTVTTEVLEETQIAGSLNMTMISQLWKFVT